MNNLGFRNWAELSAASKEMVIYELWRLADYQLKIYKSGSQGWERNSIMIKPIRPNDSKLRKLKVLGFDRKCVYTYYGTYSEYPSPKSVTIDFEKLELDSLKIIYEAAYCTIFYLPLEIFGEGASHHIFKNELDRHLSFFGPKTFIESQFLPGGEYEEEEFFFKGVFKNYLYTQVSLFLKKKGESKAICIYNNLYKESDG